MMNRVLGAVVGVLILAGLSACASRIESDVTRYHKLQRPQGETVQIAAKDPEKKGSLQFHEYAEMIGEKLGQAGFRPAAKDGVSDLIVEVDYSVDDGRVVTNSYYPGYGYYGYPYYYGGHFGHHFYHPHYSHYYRRDYSYTVYTRRLEMDIIDRESGEMLFEGVVESNGRSRNINEVMPYLIEAMFTEFPGEHGKTRHVTIEVPNDNSGRTY